MDTIFTREFPTDRRKSHNTATPRPWPPPPPPHPHLHPPPITLTESTLYLLRLLRPTGALLLSLLGIAEAYVIAQSGLATGAFYRVFVDWEPEALPVVMAHSTFWWMLCAVLAAATDYTTERLAIHWRARLIYAAHMALDDPSAMLTCRDTLSTVDQRFTTDVGGFAAALSRLAKVVVATPFKVMWYAAQTMALIGPTGVLAALAFFVLGGALQAMLVRPVADLVRHQEKLEGVFRARHVRRVEFATEIALQHGAGVERRALNTSVRHVLDNMLRLALRRCALSGASRGLEYAGAALNYLLIAYALFWSGLGPTRAPDAGSAAQLVATSSFTTLMLLFSLAQILSSAEDLSTLAGLGARVAPLFQLLGLHPSHVDAAFPRPPRSSSFFVRRYLQFLFASPPHEAPPTPHETFPLPDDAGLRPSSTPLRHDAFRNATTRPPPPRYYPPPVPPGTPSLVTLSSVSIAHPDPTRGPPLVVRDLHVALPPGGALLITGRSGTGKTTLLRALMGLSPPNELTHGHMYVPHPDEVISLTPRTLFAAPSAPDNSSSLREQVIYPWIEHEPSHEEVDVEDVGSMNVPVNEHHHGRGRGRGRGHLSPATRSDSLDRNLATDGDGDGDGDQDQDQRPSAGGRRVTRARSHNSFWPLRLDSTPISSSSLSLVSSSPGSGSFRPLSRLSSSAAGLRLASWIAPPPPNSQEADYLATWIACRSKASETPSPESDHGFGADRADRIIRVSRDVICVQALLAVGLHGLLVSVGGDLDHRRVWSEVLSPGEAQRLALARLLVHRPVLAVLDEATGCMDVAGEAMAMGAVRKAGVAIISVGHRTSLYEWHDQRLHLLGDEKGSFVVSDLGAAGAGEERGDAEEWESADG